MAATKAPVATTGAAATAPVSAPATIAATNSTAAPAASVAASVAPTTMGGSVVAMAPAPAVNPTAFKGKTLNFFQKTQYYKAVQEFIAQEVTSFVKAALIS